MGREPCKENLVFGPKTNASIRSPHNTKIPCCYIPAPPCCVPSCHLTSVEPHHRCSCMLPPCSSTTLYSHNSLSTDLHNHAFSSKDYNQCDKNAPLSNHHATTFNLKQQIKDYYKGGANEIRYCAEFVKDV